MHLNQTLFVLNSKAGATTEFANPVIGTKVPAPANFAILWKIPKPVKIAVKNIKIALEIADAYFSCNSRAFNKNCLKLAPTTN